MTLEGLGGSRMEEMSFVVSRSCCGVWLIEQRDESRSITRGFLWLGFDTTKVCCFRNTVRLHQEIDSRKTFYQKEIESMLPKHHLPAYSQLTSTHAVVFAVTLSVAGCGAKKLVCR